MVDNTNPTVEDRAELIAIAHSFGAAVIGCFFESRLADCLERNRLREGKSRVPAPALYATHKRLCWPSFAEGFDRLHYVRLLADGLFEIREWREKSSDDEAR